MIYIHVPFCRSFCTYCGFYSELAPKCASRQEEVDNKISSYCDKLIEEIYQRQEEIRASSTIDTLYIGGGTPSVLPLSVFKAIVNALTAVLSQEISDISDISEISDISDISEVPIDNGLTKESTNNYPVRENQSCYSVHRFTEFTVEVNPEDVIERGMDWLLGLKSLGVNRISMGIQSFDDDILKWMNRRHNAQGANLAFNLLRLAGFDNISVDLIFGLSHLSDKTWSDTINLALSLGMENNGELENREDNGESSNIDTRRGPEHISAYQLSVEEGSALEKLIERGRYVEASEQLCRHQYDILCEKLAEAGFEHYEISNFARKGYRAVHNSAYWSHESYVGLGPGAHSFDKENSRRFWNNPEGDVGGEVLTEEQLRLEHIMLGLRTARGVEAEYLRSHCDVEVLDACLREGSLVMIGDRIRIPESYFFISDAVIASLV